MAVGLFPGFLTPVLTPLFFPKSLTAFLTCFCRGERQKYAGEKSPQPGIDVTPTESDSPSTEPPGRGGNVFQLFFFKIVKTQDCLVKD